MRAAPPEEMPLKSNLAAAAIDIAAAMQSMLRPRLQLLKAAVLQQDLWQTFCTWQTFAAKISVAVELRLGRRSCDTWCDSDAETTRLVTCFTLQPQIHPSHPTSPEISFAPSFPVFRSCFHREASGLPLHVPGFGLSPAYKSTSMEKQLVFKAGSVLRAFSYLTLVSKPQLKVISPALDGAVPGFTMALLLPARSNWGTCQL